MRGSPRQLIAFAVVAIALGACSPGFTSTAESGNPSTAPTPDASAPPSLPAPSLTAPPATASVLPSTAPTPTTGPGALDVLLPGSAARVAVTELNLRAEPTTSAKKVETLKKGAVVIVSPYDGIWLGVGPVRKNGYTWYPVMKLQVPGSDGGLPALPTRPILLGTEVFTGWIAANDGTRPYLTAVAPRCPGSVDLRNVEAMLAAERLACFGGSPIVLEGTFGCDGCGGAFPGSFEPNWLATPEAFDFLSVDPSEQFGPLALRFAPGGPARPAAGSIIRVTVHVDDPASPSCRMSGLGSDGEVVAIPTTTAVLFCREQLVVESYEVLGTDPRFGG